MEGIQPPSGTNPGTGGKATKKGGDHKKKSKEGRAPPPGGWPKKKKLTKAERRAKQDAQREAKGLKATGKKGNPSKSESATNATAQSATHQKRRLFSHLPPHHHASSLSLNVWFGRQSGAKGTTAADSLKQRSGQQHIHPSVLQCGLKTANGVIEGANERCKSMLLAFKDFIADFTTPSNAGFTRALDKELKPQIQLLVNCRPLALSMSNAIVWLRRKISEIPVELSDSDAKEQLAISIDDFLCEKVTVAGDQIANLMLGKIVDGDVVLTYMCSSTVEKLLLNAKKNGRLFRVVVVDARPDSPSPIEGRLLMQRLVKAGIDCVYVLLNAVSYVMQEVTKVVLGCEAMLSNGVAIGFAGTASVAMVARAYSTPVLFCCETYKFCEKVQIDSIVNNELGDPAVLLPPAGADRDAMTQAPQAPRLLNLKYDTTPAQFITMVVTEVGMIPPTAVPVIVRELANQA